MGLEALLGNRQLKENLRAALEGNRLSHFYLISGPAGSGKKTLAALLAQAIFCQGERRPCGVCAACRKVQQGIHPDFITVDDPEHKTVAVKIIRQAREDAFIRPNEAQRKVYMIPQELGIEGQNALLKILEEPPEYGVFLLLTDNPEKLLPTVRSRCVELKLGALTTQELETALLREFPGTPKDALEAAIHSSGGYLGQAKQILQKGQAVEPQTLQLAHAFAQGDRLQWMSQVVPMEKWKRDALIVVLQQLQQILADALKCRAGLPAVGAVAKNICENRSAEQIRQALNHIQTSMEYAQSNVSPAAICGWLVWAMP